MLKSSIGCVLAVFVLSTALAADNWPGFRGPGAKGVADGPPAPASWDVPNNKNVKWKVAVPGLAHSSPIVWGNQVCTASAIADKPAQLRVGLYGDIASASDNGVHRWVVLCYDKATGKQLWERTAHTGVPKVQRHTKATHASSTLATDGRYIVAFFGSEGLHAYDMKGNQVWKKDFGVLNSGFFMVPDAQWGFADRKSTR